MSKLRDGGIQCYLKDEFVNSLLGNAFGGIKLVASKDDEAKVLEILKRFDEDFKNNATCPKCGSHDIELVPKKNATNGIAMILSSLFFTSFTSLDYKYKCTHCGYENNTLPESFQKDPSF